MQAEMWRKCDDRIIAVRKASQNFIITLKSFNYDKQSQKIKKPSK